MLIAAKAEKRNVNLWIILPPAALIWHSFASLPINACIGHDRCCMKGLIQFMSTPLKRQNERVHGLRLPDLFLISLRWGIFVVADPLRASWHSRFQLHRRLQEAAGRWKPWNAFGQAHWESWAPVWQIHRKRFVSAVFCWTCWDGQVQLSTSWQCCLSVRLGPQISKPHPLQKCALSATDPGKAGSAWECCSWSSLFLLFPASCRTTRQGWCQANALSVFCLFRAMNKPAAFLQ